MKKGPGRFKFYLDQVEELMNKAVTEQDPAMWLFMNNGRTPFFMLEALCRVYAGIHNPKRFEKLKTQFKLIEDGIGAIDYHNSLLVAFEADKAIPADCAGYVRRNLEDALMGLNILLKEEGWLSGKRVKKITQKLEDADWLKPEEEVAAITVFYKSAVAKIIDFVNKTRYLFDNVEEDVHELRRRLRWLSIYPQAMQGLFRFDTETAPPAHVKKYLTRDIVESPFNKLPEPGDDTSFILLNKNYFLALSWMIARLGELKDEGLLITGLTDAIKYNPGCSRNEAISEAYSRSGKKQKRMQQILNEAEEMTKTFINEKNLQQLIVKLPKTRKAAVGARKVKAGTPVKQA